MGRYILRRVVQAMVVLLAMSFVIVAIGYVGYRWMTRGERGSGLDALASMAGEG